MATPKRATRIGGGARGGPKMYLGGSKRFNEATGTYRTGAGRKPGALPPGYARAAAGGRAAMTKQLARAMTKQASMRGRVGKGGGPGAANRQAMRSSMQQLTTKRAAAKRRAR